LSCIKSVFQQI